MTAPCVLLTAVEASGDALGAALMRTLKARLGEVRFVGVGGPRMAAEGLTSAFDTGELSIMGFVEGLMAYGRAKRRAAEVAALAVRERPDIAVLIDSWGFSYLVAKALRRDLPGLTLVKYAAPQVWATRPGRAKALARTFDHLLSLLPFDLPYFENEPIEVTLVGHPILAQAAAAGDPARLRARLGLGDAPVLLILPGSRPNEITRVLPAFEDAARRLAADRPDLRIVVPAAETVAAMVREKVAAWPVAAEVVEGDAAKADAMAAATAALACSGTVTTELALAGCPMVVAYKVAPLTAWIARRIVRVRYATLFNIAADAEVAPEFIQETCNGPTLAAAVAPLLDDPRRRAAQVAAQNAALDKLGRGGGDPAEKAAEVVVGLLGKARGGT